MITYIVVALIVLGVGCVTLLLSDEFRDQRYLLFYLVVAAAAWPLLFLGTLLGAIYLNFEKSVQRRLHKQKPL